MKKKFRAGIDDVVHDVAGKRSYTAPEERERGGSVAVEVRLERVSPGTPIEEATLLVSSADVALSGGAQTAFWFPLLHWLYCAMPSHRKYLVPFVDAATTTGRRWSKAVIIFPHRKNRTETTHRRIRIRPLQTCTLSPGNFHFFQKNLLHGNIIRTCSTASYDS